MGLQFTEHPRALAFAITEYAGDGDLCVVVKDRLRHPAEELECAHMCVAECFGGLGRVTHHKDRVRMRQNHRKEVDLALNAANHTQSFTKISLGMSWRMDERYKHLLRTLAPSSHVILHDRNPARETVLVSEPLKNAPGRMSLLFGAILI